MKKVMVFGTFDILHKGHLNFFKQARRYGDFLIAVVARDSTVKQTKGRYSLNDEKQRLKDVKQYADKAVLGYKGDKYKVIHRFKPDVICLGYDQKHFLEGLQNSKVRIIKLKAYKPSIYKSSKLKKRLSN